MSRTQNPKPSNIHCRRRWEKGGRGFAALSVVSCERSSPSLFLSMLPLPNQGIGAGDDAARRAWLDETGGGLGGIFRSHTRQTLLADCPGASPQDVEREVEARAATYARCSRKTEITKSLEHGISRYWQPSLAPFSLETNQGSLFFSC